MSSVSWPEVNARRLHRHGLVEPLASPAAVATATAGVHAQVQSAAEVSAAMRLDGATRADVDAALWEDRLLVRTFGPRGTVHLLAAEDYAWWVAALGSMPRPATHPPGVRLEPDELDQVVAAIDAALTTSDHTVDELDVAVGEACGPWAVERTMAAFQDLWPRWRLAVGVAAARGVLCFGPNRGRKVAYASPRCWLPDLQLPDPSEARQRLLAAYLTAYGPATPAHLARWLAIEPAEAKRLFERADLDEVVLDGEAVYVLAGDTAYDAPEPPTVRLLPYFDAFGVGSQPRSLLFPGRAAERALAGSQAGNYPVLLLDGIVGGVWHQKRVGRRVVVTVEPLGRLSARQRRALDVEVDRLGQILDARPELVVGPVSVGPHA